MRVLKSLLVLVLMSLIVACGGASGDKKEEKKTPTDRTLDFQLFPDNFFNESFSQSFNFDIFASRGSKSNTGTGKATLSVQKGSKSDSGSLIVGERKVFDVSASYEINFKSPAVKDILRSNSIYLLHADGKTDLYSVRITSGIDKILNELYNRGGGYTPAPKTAKIGDSGYYKGTSSVMRVGWTLEDAYNGYAYFVVNVQYDKKSWKEYWKIKQNGERVGFKIVSKLEIDGALTDISITSK